LEEYRLLTRRIGAALISMLFANFFLPVSAAAPAQGKHGSNLSKPMNLWYQLTANDQPMGWLHVTSTRARWHGQSAWKIGAVFDAIHPVTKKRVILNDTDYTDLNGTLLESNDTLTNPLGTDTASAIYKGRYINATINVPVIGSRVRVTQRSRVTLKPGIRLSPEYSRDISPGDLHDGKQIERWGYDVLARKVHDVTLTVVGEMTEDLPGHPGADVWELSEVSEGSAISDLEWVNPAGVTVKMQVSIPGVPDIIATLTPHHSAPKR